MNGSSSWRSRWEVVSVCLGHFCFCVIGFLVLWAAVPVLSGQFRGVSVESGSMAPQIVPADIVLIRPTDGRRLGPGTVITFDDPALPGRRLTHRIVKRLADGRYRTKGDANPLPDSTPVRARDIEGVGRVVIPLVGAPLMWVHRGEMGRVALAVVALAWVTTAAAPRRTGARRHRWGAPATAAVLLVVIAVGLPHLTSRARFTGSTVSSNNAWQARSQFGP